MMKKKILFAIGVIVLIAGGLIIMYPTSSEEQVLTISPTSGQISKALTTEYIECLVKTGDNNGTSNPIEERRGNYKSGYIVMCKNSPNDWARLERDPKRFAIIRFLRTEFNESWLEPEYDGGNVTTRRKYKLPLDSFMTERELSDLRDIGYNEEVNWSIYKNITDVASNIELVDWENKSDDLILHGSGGVFEICVTNASGQCDYSSLSAWESGEQADLTGDAPCVANITEGFEDTTATSIDGWTTDADNYIYIVADNASGARHNGSWDGTAYILNTSSAGANLAIKEENVRVEGIQTTTSASNSGNLVTDNDVTGYRDIRYSHIISFMGQRAIYDLATSSTGTTRIWNCIAYNATGEAFYLRSANITYFYNNLAYNSPTGVRARAGVAVHAKNVISTNSSSADFVLTSGALHCFNCLSSDSTADNFDGSGNIVDASVIFADEVNNDFHLDSTDTSAKDAGLDLSSDANLSFSDDIDGETRSGTWDIGADEFITAAEDSCTYSSGTWEVDCSDDCTISSGVDLDGEDIILTGSGTFKIQADIVDFGLAHVSQSCDIICHGGCFRV